MPAQISHILAARAAWARLLPLKCPSLDDPAFFLGCQGPDIFYHNQRTKPSGLLYGARVHRWGWGRYCAQFAQLAWDSGWAFDHVGWSYLAGMVTHGILDRILHPFVVYFSGWKIPLRPETDIYKRSHAFFERMLDVLLFEHFERKNFVDCPYQAQLTSVRSFPEDFWKVSAQALWKTYPGAYFWEDALVRVKNAVTDTIGFLTYSAIQNSSGARAAASHDRSESLADPDKKPSRIALYHPAILPPEDFLNLEHRSWLHPVTGEIRNESAVDLFEESLPMIERALALAIELFDQSPETPFDSKRLEDLLGNESLNLPGSDGSPSPPRFCSPLDFDHLFEMQRMYWLKGSNV